MMAKQPNNIETENTKNSQGEQDKTTGERLNDFSRGFRNGLLPSLQQPEVNRDALSNIIPMMLLKVLLS